MINQLYINRVWTKVYYIYIALLMTKRRADIITMNTGCIHSCTSESKHEIIRITRCTVKLSKYHIQNDDLFLNVV